MLSVFKNDDKVATNQTAENNEMKRLGIMDNDGKINNNLYVPTFR